MKRGKKKNRKASMELSFQFLFSIILIAVVLFVGFYVIRMFLNNAEKVKLLQTVQDVRDKVSEVSNSEGSSYLMHFKLNSAVKYICFASASNCGVSNVPGEIPPSGFCSEISAYKLSNENMFFYPIGAAGKYNVKSAFEIYCGSESQKKDCLDVSQAKCFTRNLDNEFSFRIEKPNSDSLVYVMAA